jgi:crotonobetainyl-CoA:carnitine CoA-transferase CaiB-like acyl-CoA transferase
LLGAALAMQSGRFIWADGEDANTDRDLRSGGITGIHPTAKGGLYISANTAHFWRSLCTLVGLPDLADNPKYASVRKRAKHATEIVPAIREALKSHTALEWEEIFGEQVPCCAVRSIEEMFDHPQVLDQELVASMEHPRIGTYWGLRQPLKFSETPIPEPFAAPALGQHNDELRETVWQER